MLRYLFLHDLKMILPPENMIPSIQYRKYPLLRIRKQLESVKLKFD